MTTPTKARAGKQPRKGQRHADNHLDTEVLPLPLDDVDLETPLNAREQRFLELYFFSGEKITQYEAAKKAGSLSHKLAGHHWDLGDFPTVI